MTSTQEQAIAKMKPDDVLAVYRKIEAERRDKFVDRFLDAVVCKSID